MLVGRRLKELRRVFGITQQELGNILNVTKATICCYEKETRTPTLENLIDLSDYFEVTIDYLLGRDYLVRDNKTGKNIFISKEQYESTNLTPNALQGESMKVENINEKLKSGNLLSEKEIDYIVSNYTSGEIKDKEMSEFLLLIKEKGLSYEETFYLTKSMINSGDILDLSKINRPVVDKHSTGGVGDKLTLIISPIIASLGLGVAKMSGRSLGFTGGTIDKLESIPGYKVSLTNEEFIKQVNEIGVSIISQTGTLAPADKKIYALRDEIGAVESIPLIASSIMSKKIASGAPNIVIDLKVGKGAFMENIENATKLAEYMINIGKYFDRKVVCVLTDMNTPLGNTVGNSIEVKEAENFFLGRRDKRLNNLVISITSNMLSVGKDIPLSSAKLQVEKVLEDGSAKNKFYEWIATQGGNIKGVTLAKNKLTIKATKEGYVTEINPMKVSKLLFDLGAGRKQKTDTIDLTVGMAFIKTLNEHVNVGDSLINIFYNKEIENLEERASDIIKIESDKPEEKDIVIKLVK